MRSAALWILFCLCLLCRIPGYAQPGTYKQYTTADGLNTNMLYDLLQDNDGFIWISSLMGVYRFDGTHFQTFTMAEGLPDNEVLRINKDRHGRIWFQGFNGRISCYEKGRFLHPGNHPVLAGIHFRNIPLMFFEGQNDTIYISGQHGHTIRIHAPAEGILHASEYPWLASAYWEDLPHTFRYTPHQLHKNGILNDSLIISEGAYWIIDSCMYYHHKDGIYRFCSNTRRQILAWPDSLKLFSTHFLMKTRNEFYLLSHSQGVLEYRAREPGKYAYEKSYYGVPNPGKVLKDSNGDIWINSLTNGLFHFPQSRRNFRVLEYKPSWPGKIITEMEYAGNGTILAGFDNSCIGVFDTSLNLLNSVNLVSPQSFFPTLRILKTREANTYIAGGEGGAFILRFPQGITHSPRIICIGNGIKGISYDGNNSICFNNNSQVSEYDMHSSITRILVPHARQATIRKYTVAKTSGGDFLYTDLAGMHRLSNTGQPLPVPQHPFLKKRILHILPAGRNLYVLVSDGQGIALSDEDLNIIQEISAADLQNAVIRKARIANGQLWIAGSAGMAVFDIRPYGLSLNQVIDKSSGLLSQDVLAFCQDEEFLYVYTQYGLQKLKTDALFRRHHAPRLFIHRMESMEQEWIMPGSEIRLPPKCSEIRVECAALDLQNNSASVFAYRFNDAQSWIETGNPQFTIPIEFEGSKTLQLRCRKGHSPWSAASTLQLHVPIPFLKQARVQVFLYCLVSGLLILLTLRYTRQMRRRQMRENDMKLRIASLEIKALQAMMNPHFIFNALNSIQQFINEHDTYRGNKYLTMFSRMIRSSLKSSREPLISLHTETEYIRNYLELEKLRFGQRLEYSIHTDTGPDLKSILLPGMLIQPLVENAIKHGMLPGEGICRVHVSFQIQGERLLVNIRDNGPGLAAKNTTQPETHRSMGLDMIRERLNILSELYNKPFSLRLYDHRTEGGKGVSARLELPLLLS